MYNTMIRHNQNLACVSHYNLFKDIQSEIKIMVQQITLFKEWDIKFKGCLQFLGLYFSVKLNAIIEHI